MPSTTHPPFPFRPIPPRTNSSRSLRSVLTARPTPETYMSASHAPNLLQGILLSKLEEVQHLPATTKSTSRVGVAVGRSFEDAMAIRVRYTYMQLRDVHVWKVSRPIVGRGRGCIVGRRVSGTRQVCGCCGKGPFLRRVRRVVRRVGMYPYYVVLRGRGRDRIEEDGQFMEGEIESEAGKEEAERGTDWGGDGEWDWEVLIEEGETHEEKKTESLVPKCLAEDTVTAGLCVGAAPAVTTPAHAYRYTRGKRVDSLVGEGYWRGGLDEDTWNELVLMVRGTDEF